MIEFIILNLTAWVTATFSGVLGMGGGILLLAVMSQYFPQQILIPLHGFLQFASNISRAGLNGRDIDWRITAQFACGALLGALLGSRVQITIPQPIYQIALGIFILAATFLPRIQIQRNVGGKWVIVGGVATFIGLFFGATGPLIAPFYLNENLRKHRLVATKAACQVSLHLGKLAVYFALGFSLGPYWHLAVPMLLMVILGSYCGKWILDRVSDQHFLLLFKILIVILSARLIYLGLQAQLGSLSSSS